jgi:hypothetical protein
MTAQDFVAKTAAKAKPDSTKIARHSAIKGIILQASPTYSPQPGVSAPSLVRHFAAR